jgi:hypothetical protein
VGQFRKRHAAGAARLDLRAVGQRHSLFNTFFAIKDIEAIAHPMMGLRPSYFGIFEDNDPTKRLMVVANFDNDVPEILEWSGRSLFPFDTSNRAYSWASTTRSTDTH